MKVYILRSIDSDISQIIGAFSSAEIAEGLRKRIPTPSVVQECDVDQLASYEYGSTYIYSIRKSDGRGSLSTSWNAYLRDPKKPVIKENDDYISVNSPVSALDAEGTAKRKYQEWLRAQTGVDKAVEVG